MAFLPNSTFCGPRRTSTRSRSIIGMRESGPRAKEISSMYRVTDCSYAGLEPEAMPRICSIAPPPDSPLLKFGTYSARSSRLSMPASSILSPVRTETEIGTSCSLCSRFCAVTMISSKASSCACAPSIERPAVMPSRTARLRRNVSILISPWERRCWVLGHPRSAHALFSG